MPYPLVMETDRGGVGLLQLFALISFFEKQSITLKGLEVTLRSCMEKPYVQKADCSPPDTHIHTLELEGQLNPGLSLDLGNGAPALSPSP